MPRKSTAPRKRKTTSTRSVTKGVEAPNSFMGDEPISDSSFASVSTDENVTNYGLNYTNSSRKQKQKENTSPKRMSRSTTETTPRARKELQNESDKSVRQTRQSPTKKRNSPSKKTPQKRPVEQTESESDEEENVLQIRQAGISQREPQPSTSRRKVSPPKKQTKTNRTETVVNQRKPKRQKAALRDIRNLQATTNLLIARLPFSRLIREVILGVDYQDQNLRVTVEALQAIQEASEIYLTHLFEDCYRCTLHRARVTLSVKDMELVRFLRGPMDPGNR